MNKYDYILLPPDGFHQCFEDLLSESYRRFNEMENLLFSFSKGKNFVIKYRTEHQRYNYPTSKQSITSYGDLTSICHDNTRVIGPIGSSTIQVLGKNIEYYPYDFFKAFSSNRMIHNDYSKVLFIANNARELEINLIKRNIFKKNYNFEDLTNIDGSSLKEIVDSIIYE